MGLGWTPELMEKVLDISMEKVEEFRTSGPDSMKRRLAGNPFYDDERFLEYLQCIGAEIVEEILPEKDHFTNTIGDLIDGKEPLSDKEWKENCDTYLGRMARNTGKFPVLMPVAMSMKGYLLPNELARKILILGSFPECQ